MDNLTHSLIGAALGQAGLKRKTGLAMPALIIGANIPDIDAGCVVYGVESLAMRRGITHGPLAWVVLPLLLAGALWWFDRWQEKRGKRPAGRAPVHFGWLWALSLIATLSHPLFDWFNNYGVRLLEPFSHQWFYGDTLFIIDPWIIAMLGAGVWFSLRRERRNVSGWSVPASIALGGVGLFVVANMVISSRALHAVESAQSSIDPSFETKLMVANAVPVRFWQRDVLWRTWGWYGTTHHDLVAGTGPIRTMPRYEAECADEGPCEVPPTVAQEPTNMSDPRIAEWSKNDPAAQAFLFWSRMPVAELHEDRIILRDQRFMDPRTASQFSVTLRPPKP